MNWTVLQMLLIKLKTSRLSDFREKFDLAIFSMTPPTITPSYKIPSHGVFCRKGREAAQKTVEGNKSIAEASIIFHLSLLGGFSRPPRHPWCTHHKNVSSLLPSSAKLRVFTQFGNFPISSLFLWCVLAFMVHTQKHNQLSRKLRKGFFPERRTSRRRSPSSREYKNTPSKCCVWIPSPVPCAFSFTAESLLPSAVYGFTEHFIYYSARLHGKYVAWKALNFRIFEDEAEWAGGLWGSESRWNGHHYPFT